MAGSIGTLISGLALTLLSAQSLQAATLEPDQGTSARHQSASAFAGARLRLQLGRSSSAANRAQAGLMIAPLARSIGSDGAVRLRIGEGLALGIQPKQPLALTLAGQRLDRLGSVPGGRNVPPSERKGISTLGYAAVGVGVLLVAAFVAYGAIGDAATE